MKSSSQLFPVELVSAEDRGNHIEDIYSLKPNTSDDKSVEIALIHLHAANSVGEQQILFVHDVFQSHWQWTEGEYRSLIEDLLAQNISVWLMDWRAHGSSKKNKQLQRNSLFEMANLDVVAVEKFIFEKSKKSFIYCGQGFGALMAMLTLDQLSHVSQFLFVDAQALTRQKRYFIPFQKTFRKLQLVGKPFVSGPGSEVESPLVFKDYLSLQGFFANIRNPNRVQHLKNIIAKAEKVIWLCSDRASERSAKRHAKKQTRVHRVSKNAVAPEIIRLVTS